ncbi:MAG: hypothetical protein IJX38_02230 [Clostridia bacterium]|nr:hypothetical protein [Clostridia bacterium]MBQ8371746.1 hypothetical protein [Clostridia bacterium]
MTNTLTLSNKKIVLMRRITATVALLSSIACLLVMLLGFVPFYGEGANLIVSVKNAFKLFSLFSHSFWHCVCKVAFSAVYFIFVVRSSIEIIYALKERNVWFKTRNDMQHSRVSASGCVACLRNNILRIAVLFIISHFSYNIKLNISQIAGLIAILLINLLVNISQNLYLKRKIVESIISPLGVTVILGALFYISIDVTSVQIYDYWYAIVNAFSLFRYEKVATEFIMNMVFIELVLPVFYVIGIISLLNICAVASKNEANQNKAKIFLIRQLIFIGIIFGVQLYANGYKQFDDIMMLLKQYLGYASSCIAVFIASHVTKMEIADAPIVEEPVSDHKDENAQTAIN